jgi:hypothetical protein
MTKRAHHSRPSKLKKNNIMKLTAEEKQARKEKRQADRKAAQRQAIIDAERQQKPVREIRINIEWKKSRMWGMNPTANAEIFHKDGSYSSASYTCSGCGYDKESTVIADVFNAFLKYKLFSPLKPTDRDEKRGETTAPYGITVRTDWKYFNGGIGADCYFAISQAIGGELKKVASGKTFDVYKYTDID